MAFCPNCGTKLDEELDTGSVLDETVALSNDSSIGSGSVDTEQDYAAPVQPNVWGTTAPQYAAPQYAPPQPPVKPAVNPNQNRARITARNVATSPLFLIATIAFTISSLIGVYSTFQTFGHGMYYGSDISSVLGLLSSITTLVLSLLMVLGLWLIFGNACAHPDGRMSTAGLTIIKVAQIIIFVFYCIILLAAFIGLIAGTSFGTSYRGYHSSTVASAIITAFLLLGAVTALVIIYFCGIFRSLSTAANTIRTDRPSRRVSGFVAVICFIGALFGFISLVISLVKPNLLSELIYTLGESSAAEVLYEMGIGSIGQMSTVGLINSICAIVANVCFGATIFLYKSKMSAIGG